ncbi:GntR family transcriptional regulator [Bradyrhizobium genosp. SA-3]|uniref:GntR family transcriptional regulator n=1 Tax=Bradyrhizobium genosp. SA-3 TaxID=508868 RepID=UPI001ABEEBAF|nr:GntR family transcriptional regulator [Bradyrhizobium genosp. SA-3]
MTRGRKSASERRALTGAVTDGRAISALKDSQAMRPGFARPRSESHQAEEARQRLEEMIVTLELEPGTVWSETELSEKLELGRTPVREALKRLEAEHLVEIVPRSGAKVTQVDVMQQLLMLEMRRELERLIAVSASRRATPEERNRCIQIARYFEGMRDINVMEFLRYHYEAKRFLAECARNPFAAAAIVPCHAMSRRFYYLHNRVIHDVPVAAKLHANVFEAVALGDEQRAAEASDKLMDYAEELTRRTVLTRT